MIEADGEASSAESVHPRAAERELRAIIETIPDPIITIAPDGIIRSFSPAASRLFGYDAEEVIGRNVAMLMPSPYREEHDRYLDRYLSGGEKRIIGTGRVVFGQKRNGMTFPMELSVGDFTHDGSRIFVGMVRDVSRRETAERQLHLLQAELAEASRLTGLGEMASALAHELNQPLAALVAYLDASRTLLGTTVPERVLDLMKKASGQARRAGDIVHRLKELAQRGRTDHQIAPLGTVLEEAVALTAIGLPNHEVAVSVRTAPSLPQVLVDVTQIQQVVLNLIRNAVEAQEGQTGGEVVVRTEASDGREIVIAIADSGPGLPNEIADRLFQPFLTTKATGTGIGLSICKSIVESHGGRIWAETKAGEGTTFFFTLPVADAAPEPRGNDG